jgi:ribose transport system ATP-binding protein
MNAPAPLLEVKSIRKAFPGVVALSDVTFDLRPGEVHALVGENGAGKSTLLSIMNGLLAPDSGEIWIEGVPVVLHDPAAALANRLALVHQELVLCPNLTVAENIFLGREPSDRRSGNRKALNRMAEALLDEIHVKLDPSRLVGGLSLNEQQVVEICRALASRPKVLVFDEPTASLNDDQVAHLLAIIRKLKRNGLGIVYVSHRLGEVLDIADRVTVLRDGRVVGTRESTELSEATLVTLMVGREHKPGQTAFRDRKLGPVALEAKGIGKAAVFDDVSLTVKAGEIVGIAGLLGCQREAVVRSIFGAASIDRGEIRIFDKPVSLRSPRDAISNGMAFMPADRKGEGLILPMSVGDNIGVTILDRLGFLGWLRSGRRAAVAQDMVKLLGAKVTGLSQAVYQLSGGNQQKIVIGKWLNHGARLFIFDEPTVGVDVGTKAEIYRLFSILLRNGAGIILISSYLPEVSELADTLHVFRRGRISASYSYNGASHEDILMRAIGP